MILCGKETEERRQHSTALIPYSVYRCRIPIDFMNVPLHWHSEFELNRIIKGEGEFLCGGERWKAGAGEMLILPPNILHAAYPVSDVELIYDALVFSPVMLGANSGDRCAMECIRPLLNGSAVPAARILPSMPDYSSLWSCAERIFFCVEENSARYDLMLKSELLRLFWILESSQVLPCQEKPEMENWEALRPALEFMMEHFSEGVRVEDLARISHLSQSHFMSCFKKAVGVSAMEYLAQLRVKAACEALASSEKRISEIALSCGYGNLSNFNRQFKRIAGCTPREYRSQSSNAMEARSRKVSMEFS